MKSLVFTLKYLFYHLKLHNYKKMTKEEIKALRSMLCSTDPEQVGLGLQLLVTNEKVSYLIEHRLKLWRIDSDQSINIGHLLPMWAKNAEIWAKVAQMKLSNIENTWPVVLLDLLTIDTNIPVVGGLCVEEKWVNLDTNKYSLLDSGE